MKRSDFINLTKTIIVFSLVILFSGVAFNFNNRRKLLNPKRDTYILSSNKKDSSAISITTIDLEEAKNLKSSNDIELNIKDDQLVNMSIDKLRDLINKKFNIDVKYGSETDGYTVSDLTVQSLSDEKEIKRGLLHLYNNLSVYPNGFFSEIESGGYSLSIYLVKKYSVDNVTGITDSTGKKVVISIAVEYQFSESLHHELYHYMEKYMFLKGANYTIWGNLNPEGFGYGTPNKMLSYSYTSDVDSFFVNNYAQTSEAEDRASTFEYMTSDNKSSCLESGSHIWLKAKYMCEQIDAVFKSVSPEKQEYWERYVY